MHLYISGPLHHILVCVGIDTSMHSTTHYDHTATPTGGEPDIWNVGCRVSLIRGQGPEM